MTATCTECNGDGEFEHPFITNCSSIVAESPPDPVMFDCEHCQGSGECECDDCLCAAWERQQEDYASEPPPTAAEHHQRACDERAALRSGRPL